MFCSKVSGHLKDTATWFNESNKDSKQKTDGEAVYYTRERIDLLVGIIIIFMILLLLVVPVYMLLRVTIGPETTHSNAICIGILLTSALLFSACISAFTSEDRNCKPKWGANEISGARRQEVLGAAAACVPAFRTAWMGSVMSHC